MGQNFSDNKRYWYIEWVNAEKDGKKQWAQTCKEEYRKIVMNKLIEEPSMWYIEKLKALPTVYLN